MPDKRLALKLPRLAATAGLIAPPRLASEQCSSEATAAYKRAVVSRLLGLAAGKCTSMTDLTGGFGVDFAHLAPLFARATYVERQAALCDIARQNFPLLRLENAEIVCGEAEDVLENLAPQTLIFLDPARRDGLGRKTVLIEDCEPNVSALLPRLRARCRFLVVKLSPMLDIARAVGALEAVREIHVVATGGECRELLLVIAGCAAEENLAVPYIKEISPNAHRVSANGSDMSANGTDNSVNGTDNSVNGSDNSANGTDNSVNGTDNSVNGTDMSANGSDMSANGSDNSVNCPDKSVNGPDKSVNGTDNLAKGSDNSVNCPDNSVNCPDNSANSSRDFIPTDAPQLYVYDDGLSLSLPWGAEADAVAPMSPAPLTYLYEPGKAAMKAGIFKWIAAHFNLCKLHANSHLYTSENLLSPTEFPGRIFRVEAVRTFSKRELSELRKLYPQANLTTRNFPASTEEVRRKLRIRDGGDVYLFATTLLDGSHRIIVCRKA